MQCQLRPVFDEKCRRASRARFDGRLVKYRRIVHLADALNEYGDIADLSNQVIDHLIYFDTKEDFQSEPRPVLVGRESCRETKGKRGKFSIQRGRRFSLVIKEFDSEWVAVFRPAGGRGVHATPGTSHSEKLAVYSVFAAT